MTSKIRVLSDHTINKIAAGEVIENPASVVKELVENAIDADATDICIEIQGGGRQLIRISDNGCGMNGDDALLCLERHATSKLREVEEIHTLSTMGFRGEALPSIASISKFNILTCPLPDETHSNPTGTLVIVDGGKLISCKPAARSPGTTMEVKSLFFNVPVRKKFLKSPTIDSNEILKMVSLIAMGYPNIKFQLINDGKNLLTAQASTQNSFEERLRNRIGEILGLDITQNTLYIENQNESCRLQGVIGLPSYTRHNRTGQYLFINQRGVVSPIVSFAVRDGFGTSLPNGRHPVFILHLTVPGDLVDVNVHPQKREVRLRQEQSIKELIISTIRNSLVHQPTPVSPTNYPSMPQPATVSPVFAKSFQEHETSPYSPSSASSSNADAWIFRPKTPIAAAPDWLVPETTPKSRPPLQNSPPIPSKQPQPSINFSLPLPEPIKTPPKAIWSFSKFIVLDTTYPHEFILKRLPQAEKGGLVLIQQKGAHARVIFEKLLQQESGAALPQQALLIPQPIALPPFEAETLRSHLAHLNDFGIAIQEFGPHTFLVEAIPQIFGNSNIETLLKDLIHDLRETGEKDLVQERSKHIAMAASRASGFHDKSLNLQQAQGLIDQLFKCQHPYICPQGKSIMAHINPDELTKFFQK